MGIIATGPPKAGTSALRRLLEEMGLPRVNGSLIYERWHRHPDWVYEEGPNRLFEMTREEQREIRFYVPRYEALAQLKPDGFIHGHVPPFETEHRFIVILRDPKANIISWYRAKREKRRVDQPPDDTSKFHFRRWVLKGGPIRALGFIKPIYVPWASDMWIDDPKVLVVRYEELRWPETIDRIAQFVDKKAPSLESWWGDSSKWTGRPSQISEWFDQPTDKLFNQLWDEAPRERRI